MLDSLREKANNLPLLPGVYIMLDEQSEVIYVGKAKKLKNRVSSYFHGEHLPKVAAMVEKVRDFNVIVAASEFEALVLENSLIKRHKPRYNILLKDDKGYHYIRITDEEYPRIEAVMQKPEDEGQLIGLVGRSQKRPGVALAEPVAAQGGLHRRRQPQQPQPVGQRGRADGEADRQALLGDGVAVQYRAAGEAHIQKMQLLPL